MQRFTARQMTSALLVITPLGFLAFFSALSASFEYPSILHASTDHILRSFAEGGNGLLAQWYGLMISATLVIPTVTLFGRVLADEIGESATLKVATTFGVVAGIVQTLGFVRWPFLVPSLARTYLDPASSEATRAATATIFEAFNAYAGQGVGEHLGYLFTGLWTILIGVLLVRLSGARRILGWVAFPLALAIMSGDLALVGFSAASAINAIGYILWAVWLIVLGVNLLITQPKSQSQQA